MTAIIKNNFKLQNARDFLENFTVHSATRNHYLFVGKPTVWGQGTQAEELTPPTPQDTEYDENRIWDEMLSLKKIDQARVSLVVPRSDWDSTGNTIYAAYDDRDGNLYRQPTTERSSAFGQLTPARFAGNFYVITDEFDVFICLNNGNNSPSTVKPIRPNPATNLVNYSELDGYIWKYVTTIPSADVSKFVTDSWIPVRTLTSDDGTNPNQWLVQQSAISGQVVSVQIDNQGTGYTGTYSGGFLLGSINNTGGKGKAILTGSPSGTTNFYNNGQVHIISGPDAGSIYTIESYNGASKEITLTVPWETSGGSPIVTNASVCQILPRVDIVTNGASSIKLRPVVSAGKIVRVIILEAGTGASFVQITVPNSLGGTGAVLRAVLSNFDNGLGADIERDLGAFFVMLNARLDYTEGSGDFPLQNDYRQLGIIRDVKNYGTNTLSTASTLMATKKLTLTGISGSALTYDEIIQTSSIGTKAIVLDYTSTGVGTGTITYVQNPTTGYGIFTVGQTIQGTSSGTPFTATISAITNEEVQKRAGEILYQENRRAVLRAPDQIEDIKAIIEF